MLCGTFAVRGEEDNSISEKVNVSVQFYNPNHPNSPVARQVRELLAEDKSLSVSSWGGIQLPGGAGKASVIMAIAGKTAPDIMYEHFHVIRNDISQGFLYPLNEWIGDDKNGDGQIDGDEVKWAPWKQVPLLWRHVATVNGKIYGLPQPSYSYMGVIFRVDLARAAGLDPENPPKTWDELIYWCQRLTDPGKEILRLDKQNAPPRADAARARVAFQKGRNNLELRVVSGSNGFYAWLLLTDEPNLTPLAINPAIGKPPLIGTALGTYNPARNPSRYAEPMQRGHDPCVFYFW
jgi:hypothetical protein